MSKKDKNFRKFNGENVPETAEDIVNKAAAEEEALKQKEVGAEADMSEEACTEENAAAGAAQAAEEQQNEAGDPADEWKEKYTRQLAEFDNFRKRTEKEKSQMYDMGAKTIAEKILPTIDNFERGLQNAPDDAFAEGMQMIYRQLLKNLEDAGVKAIDCVGKEFDPNFHNAVLHEEDDSDKQNIVIEELQKGYMYKETLLRPAMVKVLN